MEAFIAAMLVLGGSGHVPTERVEKAGEAIWRIATEMDADPFLVAAVGWVETRWKPDIRSKTRDCGILQVNLRYTKFTCKELQVLDTGLREGIAKLQGWKRRFGKREKKKMLWVCHYNGGNVCEKRSLGYGRSVYRTYRKLKRTAAKKEREKRDE